MEIVRQGRHTSAAAQIAPSAQNLTANPGPVRMDACGSPAGVMDQGSWKVWAHAERYQVKCRLPPDVAISGDDQMMLVYVGPIISEHPNKSFSVSMSQILHGAYLC